MSNMEIWDKISKPPVTVLKPIGAGRLKGKTDINPQWRMQAMTEQFGPCGTGWKYTIDRLWTAPGDGVQVASFALISLFYKVGEHWSEPLPGIGGSMLVEQESKGPHTSDEAYKMAVTDALSVAMKSIGMAADIYLGNFDGSKYTNKPATTGQTTTHVELTPDQLQYFPRIKAALDKLYGEDVSQKKTLIKRLTGFTNKEGKEIPGIEDYRKKDGKSLSILCSQIEKHASDAADSAADEPVKEVCPDCSAPLIDGHCSICPF